MHHKPGAAAVVAAVAAMQGGFQAAALLGLQALATSAMLTAVSTT